MPPRIDPQVESSERREEDQSDLQKTRKNREMQRGYAVSVTSAFDADCVENFLETGYRHGLVFGLLVTADDLFANTQPAGKFSLGDCPSQFASLR